MIFSALHEATPTLAQGVDPSWWLHSSLNCLPARMLVGHPWGNVARVGLFSWFCGFGSGAMWGGLFEEIVKYCLAKLMHDIMIVG